jgi:hypothetical protein
MATDDATTMAESVLLMVFLPKGMYYRGTLRSESNIDTTRDSLIRIPLAVTLRLPGRDDTCLEVLLVGDNRRAAYRRHDALQLFRQC